MSNNYNCTYPELQSVTEFPEKLIVFLHGLGSDGNDLISLAPLMQAELIDCYFISPHAIEPYDLSPFGRQWFSTINKDPVIIQPLVKQNAPAVYEIIKNKQTELKLANKNTIIIGFSQGTMMGLYLSLIQTDPFAGMVGFSGLLIPPTECINTKTPVCIIHGIEDEIVPIQNMSIMEKYLKSHSIQHESHSLSNLGHTIDSRGLELAKEFIKGLR